MDPLQRLETVVAALSERVESLEGELSKRRAGAARKRKERARKQRIVGTFEVPDSSFMPDKRLPYKHWARVCFEFGLRGMFASEFCRWVVVEWVRQYKLNNRRKVLSLTSGRIRYFAGGVQVSCAEVDMFGRKHMNKRRHEAGELFFWNWCWAHFRFVGQEIRDLPGYEKLPKRFRERIEFAWAPYSEVCYSGNEPYDPCDPKHQTPRMQAMLDEVFTRGFRRGVQNQSPALHDAWLVERNIAPLIARACNADIVSL